MSCNRRQTTAAIYGNQRQLKGVHQSMGGKVYFVPLWLLLISSAANAQGPFIWHDSDSFGPPFNQTATWPELLQTLPPPSFTKIGPEPIPPGTLVSIYGDDLGIHAV